MRTATRAAPWADAFARLAASLAERRPGEALAIDLSAPVVPIDRLVHASTLGFLWEPAEAGASFAALGVALRVRARGPQRVGRIRRLTDAFWRRLRRAPLPGAPRPAFFGGFSFAAGRRKGPWQELGEATFTLPRWRYTVTGERAWLTFCTGGKAEQPSRVLRELSGVVERLSAPAPHLGASETRRTRLFERPQSAWHEMTAAALRAIREGPFDKLVLSRTTRARSSAPFDVARALERLRAQGAPATRFAFLERGHAFIGLTPERLVSLFRGRVRSEALAGSRKAGPGDAQALLESEKDRREHALVVDHVRSQLTPLCERLGTPAAPRIRRLPHLLHLETPFRGVARSGTHVLELVQALHPTPAVAGLPAAKAIAWLRAHESEPRGWYAGPIGWFDAAGNGDFAVALRCALVRGDRAWIPAGAGIVRGSSPAAEWAETAVKQRVLLEALGAAS